MHHVHVLYSALCNKIYIEESSDLSVQFIYHYQSTKKDWTSWYRLWRSVFYMEECENRSDVQKCEMQLKRAAGRRWIWEGIIKRQLKK